MRPWIWLAAGGGAMLTVVFMCIALWRGFSSDSVGPGAAFVSQTPVRIPSPMPTNQFDAENSFGYLKSICGLGPRITDTDAMRKQQTLLEDHFVALGGKVERQTFQAVQATAPTRRFAVTNLIVRWNPESKRRVLLGCHYDTRPKADREPVARLREGLFLGANDGASGVAFLMELGRLMPNLQRQIGVDFVFFDAEEYIWFPQDKYFLGSEYFANDYAKNRPSFSYEAVIVLDMIGDRDLEIHPDQLSATRAGPLVREIWNIAQRLGVTQFKPDVRHEILDDHISFQKIGLPAIALIDFDYPHWHRLTDTPDRCSGASLEKVSRVIVEWLRTRR